MDTLQLGVYLDTWVHIIINFIGPSQLLNKSLVVEGAPKYQAFSATLTRDIRITLNFPLGVRGVRMKTQHSALAGTWTRVWVLPEGFRVKTRHVDNPEVFGGFRQVMSEETFKKIAQM